MVVRLPMEAGAVDEVPKYTSCEVALLPAVQLSVGVRLTPVALLVGEGEVHLGPRRPQW